MTDSTAEFFQELGRRGYEPLLEKGTGTIRFDLVAASGPIAGFLRLTGATFPWRVRTPPPTAWSGRIGRCSTRWQVAM
jgi:hypothetical protein